jgi:recombinational DNA repair protein (RecF pathway)
MSHEIYTTKGYIISSEGKSESDKNFFILTKDLGLIRATAQGVRKIESKLRYSLQDFSFSEISFVMTKAGWRITSASILESSKNVTKDEVKVKTLRLLKKLWGTDEVNENLFNEIRSAFDFIDNEIEKSEVKSIEALLVLKILSHLGYWGEDKEDTFAESPFNKESVAKITEKREDIIKALNESLRATQLF